MPLHLNRRTVLAGLALPAIVRAQAASAHVVVVGGGFGGATAARYLRLRAPGLRVTLVEPEPRFFTCPFSNLYLAGLRTWDSLGHGYDGLRAAGVEVIHAQIAMQRRAERKRAAARVHHLQRNRKPLRRQGDVQAGEEGVRPLRAAGLAFKFEPCGAVGAAGKSPRTQPRKAVPAQRPARAELRKDHRNAAADRPAPRPGPTVPVSLPVDMRVDSDLVIIASTTIALAGMAYSLIGTWISAVALGLMTVVCVALLPCAMDDPSKKTS